jgi:hypothetical protein
MNKHWSRFLFLGLLLLILVVWVSKPVSGQNRALGLDWWVMSGGGGAVSNGNVSLQGTLGQPIIGVSAATEVTLSAGFWQTLWYHLFLPLMIR